MHSKAWTVVLICVVTVTFCFSEIMCWLGFSVLGIDSHLNDCFAASPAVSALNLMVVRHLSVGEGYDRRNEVFAPNAGSTLNVATIASRAPVGTAFSCCGRPTRRIDASHTRWGNTAHRKRRFYLRICVIDRFFLSTHESLSEDRIMSCTAMFTCHCRCYIEMASGSRYYIEGSVPVMPPHPSAMQRSWPGASEMNVPGGF